MSGLVQMFNTIAPETWQSFWRVNWLTKMADSLSTHREGFSCFEKRGKEKGLRESIQMQQTIKHHGKNLCACKHSVRNMVKLLSRCCILLHVPVHSGTLDNILLILASHEPLEFFHRRNPDENHIKSRISRK